jgi:hypothetical protein
VSRDAIVNLSQAAQLALARDKAPSPWICLLFCFAANIGVGMSGFGASGFREGFEAEQLEPEREPPVLPEQIPPDLEARLRERIRDSWRDWGKVSFLGLRSQE